MIGITGNFYGTAIFNGYQQPAGVGAVIGADGTGYGLIHGFVTRSFIKLKNKGLNRLRISPCKLQKYIISVYSCQKTYAFSAS
jgi:hypothetical protein